MTRPSPDQRLDRLRAGLSPSGAAVPQQQPRRRGPARFVLRTLGALLAVAAVAGGIVALLGAVPTPQSDPAVPITQRQWLMIAKDPQAHKGERIVVYGEVAQLDAATGRKAMLADVVGEPGTDDSGTNTHVVADGGFFADLVEGDYFRAEVVVVGARSYDTQIGGSTTAPELKVLTITPQPAP